MKQTELLDTEKASINRAIGIARYKVSNTQDKDERWAYINSAVSAIAGIRLLAANICVHDDELRDYAAREIKDMREYYCAGVEA